MKKYVLTLTTLALSGGIAMAQKISFEEYDLSNGLHVILHQDNSAPVVTTGVMYHVGGKDDVVGKTGFAHFFEHLLFEGTKNIERGKWFDIVSSHGGNNNAFTTADKTYYYEVFPSNNLQLGLWMEAERMLHPVINQIGVDTQKEVVKEEKRQRIVNAPYAKLGYRTAINPYLFKKHPYQQSIIGSMKDLDSATLDDFTKYNQRYYNPNNAVLVVTGDFDKAQAKQWINDYFASIPNSVGKPVRNYPQEEPIAQVIKAVEYDKNIQIPAKVYAYRTPKMTDSDAVVFDFISNILTGGNSSRMYKKMVEDKKEALQVFAFNDSQEDYGIYMMAALPLGNVSLEQLGKDMDQEITRLQNELLSEREYQKLLNQFEKRFVSSNSNMEGIALSLANAYMFHKNTNRVNEVLDLYRKVTREDIRRVAQKYLNPNQRLDLDYLPQMNEK
ncbi:peptidase M16 [Capnocytophaga catalasegens]|uniref:Peptidase M16 n=2 Tax=Capnocytophaga catalasegens TaxID=1004260 RepID=A0AAV5APS5_9FLAO|nr:peptidase M16 [Capnocytophaga catalasegens]GJM49242.1 peptidase M16 [Capnocytophaga catalasegens]GJM52392.1 peptidase M16 [Capnocytophaga catalasegens]